MNELTPAIWTTGTTEVVKTGTWRNALPAYVELPSPCHAACPVDGDIAVWIAQVKREDHHAAWVTLTDNNPFPAVAGRICHHPCEPACNRGDHDEAIAICGLERFVGDLALAEGWTFPPVAIGREEEVAVVGGGPSGLAAAFHLRRMGYAVTLFEAQPRLGGLMRYGVPPYRLSREVLDREIERIVDLGITVKTGSPVAGREAFERIRDEFDAVYLALGAGRPKRLPGLDYRQPWVVDGAEFLARANSGETPEIGPRVVVVGGGSAALDAARTARRHGRTVRILALESEGQMPAQPEEVVEAREEGIELVCGAMLQSAAAGGNGGGLTLRCVRVTFEAGDRRGEFRVDPIPDSEFTLQADTVMPSIGQDPDLSALADLVEVDRELVRVDAGQATSRDGFFAGGDLASMERFVTHAFGMGKRAARAIDRRLHPEAATETPAEPAVTADAINTYYYPARPRLAQRTVPVAERTESFAEVQLGPSRMGAMAEAERCFSCGQCIYCDNCFYYCPDTAVRREAAGYSIDADFCKGCGLCVRECPTGAIIMRDEVQ